LAQRIFLTGFPGFIGKRLVRALLDAEPDTRIAALVEPRMADAARTAAAETQTGASGNGAGGKDRIEVVEGDIADRRLGLSDSDYERLTAETTAVFHLAAIYNLAVPLEVAQRVNVDGTGNVLQFCLACEKLERHNYVSTAYVAGNRRGVVYEHELIQGQWFKNHYESTKFQAEVWVRETLDKIPTTIYRPAIVVGDSRTGDTQKFDGPYYMLRSIALSQQRGMPIAQFGRSKAPMNVVPVDFIVDALVAGSRDEPAIGETFHLVDPQPTSARDVMAALAREYAGKDPSLSVPAQLVTAMLHFKPMRALYGGAPHESIRYLSHAVRFDTRRADDLRDRHGIKAPAFFDYVEPMVRFFREHEDDPAFVPPPPS
jgi:thioester reductase-like protein